MMQLPEDSTGETRQTDLDPLFVESDPERSNVQLSGNNILPLTIAQAKAGLSQHYDVSPEKIEILIKG